MGARFQMATRGEAVSHHPRNPRQPANKEGSVTLTPQASQLPPCAKDATMGEADGGTPDMSVIVTGHHTPAPGQAERKRHDNEHVSDT